MTSTTVELENLYHPNSNGYGLKDGLHLAEADNKNIKVTNENERGDEEPALNDIAERTRRVIRGPLAPVNNFLTRVETRTVEFFRSQQTPVKLFAGVVFLTGYLIYFGFAVSLDADRATDLIYVTVFGFFCVGYWLVKKFLGKQISEGCCQPVSNILKPRKKYLMWAVVLCFSAFLIFWIIWDTGKEPSRLISLVGLLIYILIGFLFSKKRDQIKWRPVFGGFALQFIFGLVILRTDLGLNAFRWLGDRVTTFLGFSKSGTELIFGKSDVLAFSVLPIIVYFAAITYVLYYLGWMQVVINKIAWLVSVTMGTSIPESVNAAGNIFLGQTEAPLLIRPLIGKMTKSELHAIMTGGLATIAGSLMAVYITFGVSATHLISASVMSAPAALAMSKLMYPETEEPEFKNEVEVEQTKEQNIFEAIAVGASMSVPIITSIVVMMMAFVSIVALLNGVLMWFGAMVNCPQFSFEFICSYIFMPFALLMGVEIQDAFTVAELLGLKTFLTEFISYKKLGQMIRNKRSNDFVGPTLTLRSEVIATYALCGFANFGSMGVIMGALSAIDPSKRTVLSQLVFRALIAATLACFMTASIAGLLYDESRYTLIQPQTNATLS